MKRRWRLWLIPALLLIVGGSLVHPAVHWRLIGWAKGEAFYQGRPTSYWRWECEQWEAGELVYGWDYTSFSWHRIPSRWDKLVQGVVGKPSSAGRIPLQWGEAESVPVLIELVESSGGQSRLIAIEGLGYVGPPAMDAVPVLRRVMWESDFADFCAWYALRKIDPEAAAQALSNRP
jgi:hypothetical protein